MIKAGAGYPDLKLDERFGDSLQESTDGDVVARNVGERQRETGRATFVVGDGP